MGHWYKIQWLLSCHHNSLYSSNKKYIILNNGNCCKINEKHTLIGNKKTHMMWLWEKALLLVRWLERSVWGNIVFKLKLKIRKSSSGGGAGRNGGYSSRLQKAYSNTIKWKCRIHRCAICVAAHDLMLRRVYAWFNALLHFAILKFWIRALHFNFSLSLTNYIAGPECCLCLRNLNKNGDWRGYDLR